MPNRVRSSKSNIRAQTKLPESAAGQSKTKKSSRWFLIGVFLLLSIGALGAALKYLETDARRPVAERNSKLPSNQPRRESWLNAINPFLPVPTPTPQLAKEYIYAGSRLLAVEDTNANAAPPADLAVWRPSNGYWYVLKSDGSMVAVHFGANGDNPEQGDYDGDGKRVKKRGLINNQWEETIFVYDASGRLVAEYSNQVAPPEQAKVSYLTTDHLGSPRINTDALGMVTARHDYQPFGEEISRAAYGVDTVRKKFTSYERDNESDLDFAQARYYKSSHGRFTTSDPLLSSGRLASPQTWNKFAYVLNNPLSLIDPSGLYECKANKEECAKFAEGVKGQIVSAGRVNTPIPNTKIELYRLGDSDILASTFETDKDGYFEISKVSKGKYRLVIYFIINGKAVAPKYDTLILNVKKTNATKSNKLIYIKLGINCFETEKEVICKNQELTLQSVVSDFSVTVRCPISGDD